MTADIDPQTDAWTALCRRLEVLGTEMLDGKYPDSPRDVAEGRRHLAQQLACWLGWAVGNADPSAPAFQRQNDLFTQWGGPRRHRE